MSSSHEPTTFAASDAPRSASARAYCIVYLGEASTHVDLPRGETVEIGRSRSCRVHLPDPKASRIHATLTWDGTTLALCDLGSRNGTLVNGKRVTGRLALRSGDDIAVGAAHVVVGLTAPAVAPGRKLLAHADFEDRLSDEVARAHRSRRPFAVLMASLPRGADASSIGGVLRDLDVVGAYGPDDLEILLPERDAASALAVAEEVAAACADARVGVSLHPSDGPDPDRLVAAARDALRRTTPTSRVARAPHGTLTDAPVAVDPAMKRVLELVDRLAARDIAVLVNGETGVGKEVVAREIHRRGRGPDRPFVAVNCAALPETLVDSELFGHEKGAFTGALARKAGLFEAADGGTLFLDEIGELGLSTQSRLLRVLELHEVVRVGATRPVSVDVRVVAATNRDLEREVTDGRFRQDLLFRLNAFTIVVPPLRERPADLAALCTRFVEEAARATGRDRLTLSDEARRAIERWGWPGNVRELHNVLERAAVLAEGDVIDVGDLPERMREGAPGAGVLRDRVDALERESLVRALESCEGNQTKAARLLGVSRRALIYKMEKYGLKAKPG